jgi:16S rRNA (cytosine967-C5)-methyltransferase
MVHAYGRDVVTAIETVQALEPPLDLTLRPGFPSPEGEVLPTGSLRLTAFGQISTLPGYAEGGWWVQDAAAALPARLLGARPGERVLDLCAAPGGKTLQLAAAGAEVTALDISPPRMARVTANLARTGLAARTVVADALEWEPEERFDAILLDAPCSATGTIRRHPDLPHLRKESDVATLAALQDRLLDAAWQMVAPGGRLVFCTCSLLPEEGEERAAAFLARTPDARRWPFEVEEVGDPAFRTAAGELRTRPDLWAGRGGIDGFFALRARRAGG